MPRPRLPLFAGLIATVLCLPALAERIDKDELDAKTFSGVVRCREGCDIQDAIDLGMQETGTHLVFASGWRCPGIDDGWSLDYSVRRGRPALHGGIDIPMPRGTPILAVADGEVVANFDDVSSAVGIHVFLRHAPAQTGKPFWTYTEYAHLQERSPLKVGQQVHRGDVVGLTSNTGASNADIRSGGAGKFAGHVRRDALHLAVLYSDSPDYAVLNRKGGSVIPRNARWMDPVAFFRTAPPYDTPTLRALPDEKKGVDTPFQAADGSLHPQDSRISWPYPCQAR